MTEVFEQDTQATETIEEVRSYAQFEKFLTGKAADETFTAEQVLAAVVNIKNNKGKNRGALAGIAVEDMTLEQAKIELRNANSVLYKSKKRDADAELITKHEQRVATVKARIEELKPTPAPAAETTDNGSEAVTEGEGVYTDQEALEEL